MHHLHHQIVMLQMEMVQLGSMSLPWSVPHTYEIFQGSTCRRAVKQIQATMSAERRLYILMGA